MGYRRYIYSSQDAATWNLVNNRTPFDSRM